MQLINRVIGGLTVLNILSSTYDGNVTQRVNKIF